MKTTAPEDNSAQFIRLAELLWGYGYQTRAARHFEVSSRTVRRWVAREAIIPERIMAELLVMVNIAPPPDSNSDQDRDDACAAALEPVLTDLRNRAMGSGWRPAEIDSAIFSLTISEIRANGGAEVAREILADVARQL